MDPIQAPADGEHTNHYVRTSFASVDTDVTQVDSSNPDSSLHRDIQLEHFDGNWNTGTHTVCESCSIKPEPRDIQLSVASLDVTRRNDNFMEETEEDGKRKRMIVLIVGLLCLGGVLQGILVNGLINVVISTLEKRCLTAINIFFQIQLGCTYNIMYNFRKNQFFQIQLGCTYNIMDNFRKNQFS